MSDGDIPACYYQTRLVIYRVARSAYTAIDLKDIAHPYWIVSHVRRGQVTTTSQGLTFTAASGDVMIHPPHVPFSERAENPGVHEWFMIDVQTRDHVELFRLYPIFPVVTLTDPEVFVEGFSAMLRAWHDTRHQFRNERLTAFAQLLIAQLLTDWHIHGAVVRPDALSTQLDQFTAVIRFMHEHLEDPIRLTDLAQVVHLHPNYFHRVFKRTYGMSPAEMLRRVRLERARALLESTTEPIEQVAQACGIPDAAYFTRWFRRAVGSTPRIYRRQSQSARDGYTVHTPPRP